MKIVFWTSVFLLVYNFIGYPLMLGVFSFFRRRKPCPVRTDLPKISVLLSVYNEEKIIKTKIDNFLSLQYPAQLVEMIIVSDSSNDRTEEIIRSYRDSRIVFQKQSRRAGKTAALNEAVKLAQGELLVFTDANSIFEKNALKLLASHFSDSSIGLVSGRSVYLNSQNGREENGGAYHAYEQALKVQESRFLSIIGADGALYAMRKKLYEPLRSEFINDFIHPIQTVLQGYRALNETQAICTELIEENRRDELARQIRIMAQSWLIYLSQIGKLIRHGKWAYAWELTSHKFLRWLTLPFLTALFISSSFLWYAGPLFKAAFLLQAMFLVFVLSGRLARRGLLQSGYLFTVVHFAAIVGLCKLLSGNVYATWNPRNN